MLAKTFPMTKQQQIEYLHLDPLEGNSYVRDVIVKWLKTGNIYGCRYLGNIRNFDRHERRDVLRRNRKIFKQKVNYAK